MLGTLILETKEERKMPPKNSGDQKRKKRKARAALLVFLRRLRTSCKAIGSLDSWKQMTQELTGLLQEYAEVIPVEHSQRLTKALASGEEAMRSGTAAHSGIGQACKVLENNLGRLIKALPAGGGLAGVVVGGFIAVAVIIGAIYGYLEYTAVEITVVNEGCSPIILPAELPVPVPGLSLPGPILPGRSEEVKVPRLIKGTVDAARSEDIVITVAGASVHYDLGRQISSIRLDGQEILGRRTFVDLSQQRQHELIISCK